MLESDEVKGSKGKLSITPPSSPTSLSSFSSKPIGQNGCYDNPALSTPRLSENDGTFKYLDSRSFGDGEVFTITSNGSPNNTHSLSNKSVTSDPVARGNSAFSADRYKWTDSDVTDGANAQRKTNTRKICFILCVIVLVLGLLAGVAVILSFTVFKKGEDTVKLETTTQSTVAAINLEGALDLQETWTVDLDDPTSPLYQETERTFIREMDVLMRQSNLSDSYIGTTVLSFSPGSIKVDFKMTFNEKYRLKVDTDKKLAERVEQEIQESAEKTPLRIVRETVQVNPRDPVAKSSTFLDESSTLTMDSSIVSSLTYTSTTLATSVVSTTSFPEITKTSVITATVSDSVLSSSSDKLMSASFSSSSILSTSAIINFPSSKIIDPSSSSSMSVSSDSALPKSLSFSTSISVKETPLYTSSTISPTSTSMAVSSVFASSLLSTTSLLKSKAISLDKSKSISTASISEASSDNEVPTHRAPSLVSSSQILNSQISEPISTMLSTAFDVPLISSFEASPEPMALGTTTTVVSISPTPSSSRPSITSTGVKMTDSISSSNDLTFPSSNTPKHDTSLSKSKTNINSASIASDTASAVSSVSLSTSISTTLSSTSTTISSTGSLGTSFSVIRPSGTTTRTISTKGITSHSSTATPTIITSTTPTSTSSKILSSTRPGPTVLDSKIISTPSAISTTSTMPTTITTRITFITTSNITMPIIAAFKSTSTTMQTTTAQKTSSTTLSRTAPRRTTTTSSRTSTSITTPKVTTSTTLSTTTPRSTTSTSLGTTTPRRTTTPRSTMPFTTTPKSTTSTAQDTTTPRSETGTTPSTTTPRSTPIPRSTAGTTPTRSTQISTTISKPITSTSRSTSTTTPIITTQTKTSNTSSTSHMGVTSATLFVSNDTHTKIPTKSKAAPITTSVIQSTSMYTTNAMSSIGSSATATGNIATSARTLASTSTSTTTTPVTTTTSTPTTAKTTTTKVQTTTVPNRPPKADAGPDVYINLPTNTVTLSASASTDDRGIVEYKWTQISTLSATMEGENTEELKLSNLQEGDYVFRLTVKDEAKLPSSDIVRIYVMPELCVEVTVDACRELGYKLTQFPNILGQDDQDQAIQVFKQKASPIHNQICQNVALSYLCSLYFPQCNDTNGYILFPCRSLCEEAVSSCSEYFINPIDCNEWADTDCVEPPTIPSTTTAPLPTCEETREQDCIALGFNHTSFPNLLDEVSQADSLVTYDAYLRDIAHMGESVCHPDVSYFICGSQFPLCIDGKQYKPCRRLCEEVVAACEEVSYYFFCQLYPDIDCVAPDQPIAARLQSTPSKKRKCRADQFTCSKVTKCVDAEKVCDGNNDCSDWSDEMDCQCDAQYEFQCKMGMCIKSFQECDGVSQCPDNSDELHCDGCRNGQVRCPNTDKCIMREWLCDGQNECDDGWDEWHCDRCSRSNFTCELDRSCIPMTKRCDGRDDCSQGEDEWNCVKQDGDMLQLRYQKLFLPVCANSWNDSLGNYTCQVLLGEGPFIESTDVLYNGLAFAKLQADGNVPSLLGNITMAMDCRGNRAVHIKCEPRGCGKRILGHTSYIANGEDAAHGNWPWHAALYMGNIYFCGGTLINEQFVITAAHCVEKYTGDFRSKMTVKLGANNRNKSEVTQRVISVQAISSHSMHVWFERNDIALLQLANPVNFTEYIQPVCLPDENEPLPLHSECWTIGWGKTKWDADYAEVLQQLKMTLWDTQKCNSSIAWNGEVYDTFLCAGYYSGIRSICKGDSGGPLLCMDRRRVWRIVGINSYVANFCNMTARPNIFTDVKDFIPWIADITECKFRCDNGKCLYSSEAICNREDNCGDNSDEIRECNYTAACSFDDQFLCGYNWTGWGYGFDNKKAVMIELDGQFHTQSYAPQFDSTHGSLPGYFFYGKLNNYKDAKLWSPKFKLTGQTCVRFAYYLRGDISDGLYVNMLEYYGNGSHTKRQYWRSPVYIMGTDEWRTGYFDVTLGEFQIEFRTAELLKIAVDDVKTIPGMCHNVLCDPKTEYRCRTQDGVQDKCIPRASRCNLVMDCDNGEDERSCTPDTNSYVCTFENGNVCGLRQAVGDASDWWLTNGTFVRDESLQQTFEDHTSNSQSGRMFYMNAYNLQSTSSIYMSQFFYLHSNQYCLSFYYIRKADVNFTVHIQADPYPSEQYSILPTFYGWTLFQVNMAQAEVANVTYDIKGLNISFYSYVVIDDIMVKPGKCPQYDCPVGYTKCATVDRCYPGRARCDRTVDCQDESDEANCECTAREFRCTNGRCIPDTNMCDRSIQCLDGSDERACVSYENVTCNFEHPYLCGYEFQSYSKYSWRRFKGQTFTPVTGPQYDHTLGNENGYYVYTEANEGSDGDNATLRSPRFYSGYGNSIEFWYHLFSSSPFDTRPGMLLFILENADTGQQTVKWASDNNLVDAWRRLCFDLPTGQSLVALFTAIRNETTDHGVDFAIDDVKYNGYRCGETPQSTTPFYTPTTTYGPISTGALWYCSNGNGIPASYRCDQEPDCNDGSDERDCPA